MKGKPNAARTFRRLADLTPRQLQRLRQITHALRGTTQQQADELLAIAGAVRGLGPVR